MPAAQSVRPIHSMTAITRVMLRLVILAGIGAVASPVLISKAEAQQPFEAKRGSTRKPPDRFLCNRYMREFDTKLRAHADPDSWNVKRAKVLRQEASLLCRAGQRGEGQLLLQAAIRGLGHPKEPKPSTLIDTRIDTYNQRKAIIDQRKASPAFAPIPPYDRPTGQ